MLISPGNNTNEFYGYFALVIQHTEQICCTFGSLRQPVTM